MRQVLNADQILAIPLRTFVHDVPMLGTVTLQDVALNTVIDAEKLAADSPEDERSRVFTHYVLSQLLIAPISYAYPHNYKDIIVRGDNWKTVFSSVFANKKGELETCFTWWTEVSDPIAHVRPIADDDYKQFLVTVNWLQSTIMIAIGPAF